MSGDIEMNPGPSEQLTLQDLSEVRGALYEARAKWYDIGIELKLSIGTLDTIREDFTCAADCLRQTCIHWLKRSDPCPSWEALTKALKSPPVGEGHLAQQLSDKFCGGGEEMIPHIYSTSQSSLPGVPPNSQGLPSSPITGPQGTSHHAAVTTPPHQPSPALADLGTLLGSLESIRANWYNFGLQLRVDVGILDGIKVRYSDPLDCLQETLKHWLKTSPNCTWKCIVEALSSPIVGANMLARDLERKQCPQLDTHVPLAQTSHTLEQVLNHEASTSTIPEGPPPAKRPCYSCVGSSSSPTPAVAKYAHYLRVYYSRSSLPENNKFPPTPSKYYINLAYIARRTMSKHESEKFKEAMVRGEIDKIARDKGLDFSDVAERLTDGPYPQVVLVEGAPGVGKTTFAWEFCRKWGRGESKQEYSLVILLRLRDKRIQEGKCLRDLFYHPDETLPDVIAAELINSFGEGVLILLEGLDELPERQRTESSVFLDLIHGRLLPLATVLITTRPWASEYLHKNCKEKISQHVEILGFKKQQIQNYLQSVCTPDDDPSLLSDIEKYLSCYPQIHATMYIPLNAAIVVEVYRRSRTGECIIPQTMTQLYTALSQTLLIRYLGEHPVHKKAKWKIHNFSDLPSDVYEHFLQLSKVAYDSIKNDQKLVFASEDLPDNIETLGFMQSVPELYVNESFSHNFLHLTIQEYLAAVHITQLSPEEQLKHFDECGDSLFKVVIKFVAGLTKFSEIPSDSVRALFGKYGRAHGQLKYDCDYTVNSDHVNWMFETQDPDTINAMLGSGKTIRFEGHSLMLFDYYCLGYCIAKICCGWNWKVHNIAEQDINMLTIGGNTLHESKQTTSPVSTDLPRLLVRTLRLLPSLKVLEWSSSRLSLGGLSELCDLLESTSNNLENIEIRDTTDYYDYYDYTRPSYVTIEGTYQHTSVLVDVRISSVDDVTNTVSVLTEYSNLGLHLTACTIVGEFEYMHGDLVCQLAEVLRDTAALEKLILIIPCHIGIKDAMAIAKLMLNSKSLRKVDVREPDFWSPTRFSCQEEKILSWEMRNETITVEYVRELCDLLASSSNRFEHIDIDLMLNDPCLYGYYYDDDSDDEDNESCVTIEGTYQHTSVSVEVCISSMDDITTAVSVLTEYSDLGLYFTGIQLQVPCESIDGDLACRLAEALHDTTTLDTLKVADNPIEMKGAMAIAKLIHKNKSLEVVKLRDCNIDCEGACHLAKALCNDTTPRNVNLSYNPIGTKGAMALPKTMHGKSLQEVNMSDSNKDSEGKYACHLAQALCENTRLKILDLSNNPFGTEGAMALAKLIHHSNSLVEVNMSDCNIGSEGTCHLAQALCENTTLRELYLSSNPFGTEGAMALAKLIHHNNSLVEVDMSDCNIGSEGTCHLAQALCENTRVRILDLSDNPFGTEGAMALAKLIHHSKSLVEVNMSDCNIGSEGTCHLAQALCENTTLRDLNLSHNPFGTEGAMALAKLFHHNNSLEKVDMSDCNIGSEGTCQLAQALCENTTLRELYLSSNPVGQEGAFALAEMLHSNTSLRIYI